MSSEIYFPPIDPVWEFFRDSVRFYAVNQRNTVVCLIPAEVLMAHFGARDMSPAESLRVFNANRAGIESVARRKIEAEASRTPTLREIVLTAADFQPARTNSELNPDPRIDTRISGNILVDPELLAIAKTTDDLLEERLVESRRKVSVAWDAIPIPNKPSLLSLTLTDHESGASVQRVFTRDDLRVESDARFALFLLWDSLLAERSRKLVEAAHSASEDRE
jgi:Protein of unknown function (DUF1488)